MTETETEKIKMTQSTAATTTQQISIIQPTTSTVYDKDTTENITTIQ